MLANGQSQFGLGLDYLVLLAIIAALVVLATRMYPRLTQ